MWSLKFIPYGKSPFSLNLTEEHRQSSDLENIADYCSQNNYIFSDLSYELKIQGEPISSIKKVYVYINDVFEPSTYKKGEICFPDLNGNNKRIFLDCFGFVKLDIILLKEDESKQSLTTDYLPVLVKRGALNETVKAMVHYVYTHQELLSLNGELISRDLAGFHNSNYRNLAAQIVLIQQIAIIYEKNFGYFKANSRYRIDKEPTVDYLEHLQYITPVTIEYTVTHPEQLKQVNSSTGVRVGNRIYQPQKTKFLKNVISYDTYENHVILDFLQLMVWSIKELAKQCQALLKRIPDKEDYSSEYIYSSFFMFAETRKTLEDGAEKLDKLSEKFVQLYDSYSHVFKFDKFNKLQMKVQPRPTSVFMSVPQYNQIFVRIQQWFSLGIYDFEQEKFMLSFLKISTVYEKYLLAKISEYIIDCGYTLCKSSRCKYSFTKEVKYKNASGDNTFLFSNGQMNITLYYQPVIYNADSRSINGIGLYRNNSIPSDNENYDGFNGGSYYAPDFLIKIEENGTFKYLILDAKFSSLNTVKTYDVKELAFKYLFSISPIDSQNTVLGMCLIYGKCSEKEELLNVYDNQMPNKKIIPIAEILPLMEGISDDEQYTNLDKLFKKIL